MNIELISASAEDKKSHSYSGHVIQNKELSIYDVLAKKSETYCQKCDYHEAIFFDEKFGEICSKCRAWFCNEPA